MADENPYRKSMSPEDLAARQALLEQQNQYRLMQNQMKSADTEEHIRQRFADTPANARPRLSSGFISDDTYAPTLSQYIGGVSITPAIQDIEKQAQQKDVAITNLQGLYRNLSRLNPDEKVIQEEMAKFQKQANELASSKDKHAYQKAPILGQQWAQDLSSNRTKIGAAYTNYKARAAHQELLDKLLAKGAKDGGISPEDYDMAVKIADAEYAKKGGIGEGKNGIFNSYNPVMPATYVDQNKIMNDAIANWNKDGKGWAISGAVVDGKIVGDKVIRGGVEGYIVKSSKSQKETFISTDEVRNNLAPVLGNDSMLQSYYKWQAKVNDFGASDEQITKFGNNALNNIIDTVGKQQTILSDLNQLPKSKETNKRIEDIKNSIAQNTKAGEMYKEAVEKAQAGDLNPLRNIGQQQLVSKYNSDLVNLGVAKTDFRTPEYTSSIDVSVDANYADGQKMKQMMGNQILKQNGQLVAQPRFKSTTEFGDFTKATTGQMLDIRKQLSTLIGDSEPNIMNWDMATVKAKLDEYATKATLTNADPDFGLSGKNSWVHSSAFRNLKSTFDETYQKQQYATQRYEDAKAKVLKENPKLLAEIEAEKNNPSYTLSGLGGGYGTVGGGYNIGAGLKASKLEKLISEKLATTKNLPSQSMMFPEIRKQDGTTDYKSSVGLRDVVKEFIGSNGKSDKDGNIILEPGTLSNMKGVAVRLEGQDPNAEPTSLEEALKLEDGIDMSKSIQFGTNQLSFNVLSGDIVIPVRYTVDGGYLGKERIVEKDIHISTNESNGYTNEWLKNFNNSPDMKAKKSYTQALAEQQSGIATPQQYEGIVKYDLDNQKVIITYPDKGEVKYGLNVGLIQVANLEKALNKLSQK